MIIFKIGHAVFDDPQKARDFIYRCRRKENSEGKLIIIYYWHPNKTKKLLTKEKWLIQKYGAVSWQESKTIKEE